MTRSPSGTGSAPGDVVDVRPHAEAVLAVGRLQGGVAAFKLFVILQQEYGLQLLDVDLAAGPKTAGQDFFTVTYIRQTLASLGHLEDAYRATEKGDREGAVEHTKKAAAVATMDIERIQALFAAYQERKKS